LLLLELLRNSFIATAKTSFITGTLCNIWAEIVDSIDPIVYNFQ
jgi:hypothetical protein